jgi:uncharacterized Ntn-hydrolase superfamily protein
VSKAYLIPVLFFASCLNAQVQLDPFASTYSIIARDPVTGEMGIAVQSHAFSVGSIVGWGEAGVGVVATQSFVNKSYGLRGLDLLKKGFSPKEAIDSLIAGDEDRDYRQVAILDNKGNASSYTGSKCVYAAGNISGMNFSVQANMMLKNTVWNAMSESFRSSTGSLAVRLVAALEAAQKEGGDMRGMESAYLVIYRGESTGKLWEDKIMDLRVDDNPAPLKELKRLLNVFSAQEHKWKFLTLIDKEDYAGALKEYNTSVELQPENTETKVWYAVNLASKHKMPEALAVFREVFLKEEFWREYVKRLAASGVLEIPENDLQKILSIK